MHDLAVGNVLRTVRIRRRWRQDDVALRARVSQAQVSLAERGLLEDLSLRALRRIARALEVDLPFAPRWRGPDLDRILDAGHARLVELVLRELATLGWIAVPEWSFNHFGERGSVDIVAWHPDHRALLVVEVKTRVVDVQALLATVDRKARVARELLPAERGWSVAYVGRMIVLPSGSTHRDAVARHAATFARAFPARTRAMRRWLRAPIGSTSGILFLRDKAGTDAARGIQRVHRPRPPIPPRTPPSALRRSARTSRPDS